MKVSLARTTLVNEQYYKGFFVPNYKPTFSLPFGNGPVRVGTQGLFHLVLKTFVVTFLTRLTVRGFPRIAFS